MRVIGRVELCMIIIIIIILLFLSNTGYPLALANQNQVIYNDDAFFTTYFKCKISTQDPEHIGRNKDRRRTNSTVSSWGNPASYLV
jgi:hypothetical protein